MDTWRFLKLEANDAFTNMAIDEAILIAKIRALVPNTLRVYCWKPSAVSVGKFQRVEKEVQMKHCGQLGIDIVRRITGGGAVFHAALGEVTYSVVASKDELGGDVGRVYSRIYSGLTHALGHIGVSADFNEGNAKACPNLTVNDRKISGSAQCHKGGVVLQHGTILISVDLMEMFNCLRVPWTRNCMEIAKVAKHKITSLKDELGRNIPTSEIEEALRKGFEQILDRKFVASKLSAFESVTAETLRVQKYITADWNIHAKSAG